jgi:hypothetical protein
MVEDFTNCGYGDIIRDRYVPLATPSRISRPRAATFLHSPTSDFNKLTREGLSISSITFLYPLFCYKYKV